MFRGEEDVRFGESQGGEGGGGGGREGGRGGRQGQQPGEITIPPTPKDGGREGGYPSPPRKVKESRQDLRDPWHG